jgi:hypothetical protein
LRLARSAARRYCRLHSSRCTIIRQKTPSDRQHEQRVAGGEKVVGHHTGAVLQGGVDLADGRRLDDVEEPEDAEGDRVAQRIAAGEKKDEQERGNFVDDDAAVIGRAQMASGYLRGPRADEGQRSDREQPATVACIHAQRPGDRQRDERAERAGHARRQPCTEAECDEMRRMRHEKSERRCGDRDGHGVAASIRNGRTRAAAHASRRPARRGSSARDRR